ncbi:Altronate oxidoreductase [compost metagenome]
MNLSKRNLAKLAVHPVDLPHYSIFDLPEKVIQFGTGSLLRGLPDDFIHRANQVGLFNGRIVVVKSTTQGDSSAFDTQDALYTLCVQGYANGKIVDHQQVNASISRVLSAQQSWPEILETAKNPHLEILLSNTTEAGLVEDQGDIGDNPPASFAAKVTAYLYTRFRHFNGDPTKGLIIIPTELVPDNAQVLKEIILKITERQNLKPEFVRWITSANHFCNSLVDRIVPGSISSSILPYEDQLAIMAEPYRLWAIETDDESVKKRLSFSAIDPAIKLVSDIEQYKEIKLRLLNATHTLCCGIALLSSVEYVKDFFQIPVFDRFMRHILFNEIGPTLQHYAHIEQAAWEEFGKAVIDRFKNPFLAHRWDAIALQYTTKMKMRVFPLLAPWYSFQGKPPVGLAIGVAAYLLVIREAASGRLVFQDDLQPLVAPYIDSSTSTTALLSDRQIWEISLADYPEFSHLVQELLEFIETNSIEQVIEKYLKINSH